MQFIITRTSTEQFAVEADTPKSAREVFDKGQGNPMSSNETISVQPRPQPATTPIQTGVRITS